MGLTPAQLAAIKQGLTPQYSATGGGEAGSSSYIPSQVTYGGQNYVPDGQGGYWGFADNPQWDTGSSTAGYNGTPYTSYDGQGNQTGDGKLSGIQNDSFMRSWGPFIATAALMAPAVAPSLGAAMSFGTNPVLGATATDAGGALASTAGSVAAGSTGGATTAGADVGSGALQTLGGVPQVTIPAASTFPEFSTGASKWLGPAATLLGAAFGSQPVKQTQTSSTSKDPRVAPYLFGDGSNPGLLGYTAQQLASDQSPQNQAQIQQMKNIGMGLLNAPVAGNGFGVVTKKKA